MFFYLDHELHDRELSDFEQHLERCIECRSLCDQESCIIESVRAAQPMHVASPELWDRRKGAIIRRHLSFFSLRK